MNPPRHPTHEPGVAPSLDHPPARLGPRARRAFERARDDAAAWGAEGFGAGRLLALEAAIPLGVPLERPHLRVAIGDPQAPLAIFLEILDRNDLLSEDG